MATSSSFSASFPEGLFRENIKNAMLMGIPESEDERLAFCWRRNETFSPDDPAGNPYDWTSPPVTDEPGNPDLADTGDDQSLTVPYALEFTARAAGEASTVLGEMQTNRAVVTMFDSDFDQIRTADYAVIGDTRYRILFDAPPVGLFGVTVHQLHLEAEDST